MALNDSEIIHVYKGLQLAFPEDLHIARPLIQMLQAQGDIPAAREMAMQMARRMLARGRPGDAISFLEICKRLEHPDRDEIEAMSTVAHITSDTLVDTEPGGRQTFALIDQLSDFEAREFFTSGSLKEVAEGDTIVTQGEVSRSFYLILEGTMRVHMETGSGQHVELSTLRSGDFFGEFACVYRLPRSASVTASSHALLLEFSDQAITELIGQSPIAGERLMRTVQIRLLQSVSYGHPAFRELAEADRKWLAEDSRLIEFQDGAAIALNDELADCCCIIVYGTATARRNHNGAPLEHQLTTGDIFGNVHPQLRLPRDTLIQTNDRCLICCMPKTIFQSFINAYAGFDRWIEAHGKQRQLLLFPQEGFSPAEH